MRELHAPSLTLNLMLGRKRGGLEQVCVDYAEALALAGIPHHTLVARGAWVAETLRAQSLSFDSLRYTGFWNPLAVYGLRARSLGATAVICHGNKALKLALRAFSGRIPVIAVAHNGALRLFPKADRCWAVSAHLVAQLQAMGCRAVWMPNMVRIPEPMAERSPRRTPPVIATLGRFDAKKGFDILLEASALLRDRNIPHRLVLGGAGDEEPALRAQALRLRIAAQVEFFGWVSDKAAFFAAADLFVLPSRQEAFGLALVEAMAYGVPVLASDADGPRGILANSANGMLVKRHDAAALAEGISALLADPDRASAMGASGRAYVTTQFSPAALATRLQQALSHDVCGVISG